MADRGAPHSDWRFNPTPPASVERSTVLSSSLLNRSISAGRASEGTPPWSMRCPTPIASRRSAASFSISVHSENTSTLLVPVARSHRRAQRARRASTRRPSTPESAWPCCTPGALRSDAWSRFCSAGLSGRRSATLTSIAAVRRYRLELLLLLRERDVARLLRQRRELREHGLLWPPEHTGAIVRRSAARFL